MNNIMYKLINKQTGESHLCDKVIIDGFDYYLGEVVQLNGENLKHQEFYIEHTQIKPDRYCLFKNTSMIDDYGFENCFKIFATNNPNIDCPKVVDVVEVMAYQLYPKDEFWVGDLATGRMFDQNSKERIHFIAGYNKSQETHPNSDEDMIDFLKFYKSYILMLKENGWEEVESSEYRILEVWKSQQPKTVYYE